MNIHDLLSRSDAICKTYEKYLIVPTDPKLEAKKKNLDAFELQHDQLEMRIIDLEEQAKNSSKLRAGAERAEGNAVVRRGKATLIADLDALQVATPKMKGTKELAAERLTFVKQLRERTENIDDGMNLVRKKPGANAGKRGSLFGPKAPSQHVEVDVDEMKQLSDNPSYYETTDENQAFASEWQQRKAKQDDQLDDIGAGVGRLQELAKDMNSELQKQDILVDEIEVNMDKATKKVQTNNQKMAGVLKNVASTRNFCMDIILICVLLAVLAFIYTQVA